MQGLWGSVYGTARGHVNREIDIDTPLISVVVPIYMIDQYIGVCIESILRQFLDVDAIQTEKAKRKREVSSHT